jgi:hypothetical protein
MPLKKKRRKRGVPAGAYALFLAVFAATVFVSHVPFLDLPFFWDEAGQFVPAALDVYHSGALVPRSATPNAHPPGVMLYLAAVWALFGFSIEATRVAMLAVAATALMVVFLLAIKLCEGAKGAPAFFVALLLACSPVFFAQSMLAQLDMPTMLFTALALLLFLQDRIFLSAVACLCLVLVKETGVVAPVLFGVWLLAERRTLQAGYFLLPGAALGAWFLFLRHETGHLFGSASFTEYNLEYLSHPVRTAFALAKRLYHLFFENLHWIGTFGLIYGWIQGLFVSRAWRISAALVLIHIAMFSVMGGAMLERYLLPVVPIVYIAMVLGWTAAPSHWRWAGPVALIAAATAGNFWNPPYPYPLENNLAFVDFVRLQQTAAKFVEDRYPGRAIATAWPLSAALTQPRLGYVKSPAQVRGMRDFTHASVASIEPGDIEVFVLYSRQWDPPGSLLRHPLIFRIWRRFFSYEQQVSPDEIDERFQMKPVAAWADGGHWIEIHAR